MKCPFCSMEFDRLPDIVRHVRLKHPLGNTCPICGVHCRSVIQHFLSLRDYCKLHAVFYYLYGGRKKGRRPYRDLTIELLEKGIVLNYKARNLGRVFYSIYNGTILIRRVDICHVIVIPFKEFESIYEKLPTRCNSKTLKKVANKYNLNLGHMHVDVFRVMSDLFGGEVVNSRGAIYIKGVGGDVGREAEFFGVGNAKKEG